MANLTASITNASRSVKGLQKTWFGNRTDFTFTKATNVLSGITALSGKKLYTASGCKDFNNVGHEAKVFENLCTAYKHKYTLSVTEANSTDPVAKAAAQANIDNADDIFVIVKTNDGTLLAYGLDFGLWKATQTQMANDNNGLTAVEFATREGMEETYSKYYCTIPEATLNGLL
jgi:hypothetical protein